MKRYFGLCRYSDGRPIQKENPVTDKSSYSQEYVRDQIAAFDNKIVQNTKARQSWVDLLEEPRDAGTDERLKRIEARLRKLEAAERQRNGPMTW